MNYFAQDWYIVYCSIGKCICFTTRVLGTSDHVFSFKPILYMSGIHIVQVCTSEEEEVLSRGSKKSEKLRQMLMKDLPTELIGKHMFNLERNYLSNNKARLSQNLSQAEKHKEKLLEYDKTRYVFVTNN